MDDRVGLSRLDRRRDPGASRSSSRGRRDELDPVPAKHHRDIRADEAGGTGQEDALKSPPRPPRPQPADARAATATRRARSRAARGRRRRRAVTVLRRARRRTPPTRVRSSPGSAPGRGAAPGARCRSADRPSVGRRVVGEGHPRGAEDLDALIEAVDRPARVVDQREAAVRVDERDGTVSRSPLGERRLDADRAAREHLDDVAAGHDSAPCRSRGSSCRGRSHLRP